MLSTILICFDTTFVSLCHKRRMLMSFHFVWFYRCGRMQKRALYERWYMHGCSRLVHLFVRAWKHTSAVFYRLGLDFVFICEMIIDLMCYKWTSKCSIVCSKYTIGTPEYLCHEHLDKTHILYKLLPRIWGYVTRIKHLKCLLSVC